MLFFINHDARGGGHGSVGPPNFSKNRKRGNSFNFMQKMEMNKDFSFVNRHSDFLTKNGNSDGNLADGRQFRGFSAPKCDFLLAK